MPILIKSRQIRILKRARRKMGYSQLELSNHAKVAIRTIKDIEAGRRISYNESTLIALCRTLNLDFNRIFIDGRLGKSKLVPYLWIGSGLLLVALAAGFFGYRSISTPESPGRRDWIERESQLRPAHYNPQWDDGNAINVNYFHLEQVAKTRDTVDVELKWSYHFSDGPPPSTPLYYINAYTQWDPDEEIPIFEGILRGESSDTLHFDFVCPDDPGLYDIRVFFASSYGPITSYYGHPEPNQLPNPNSAPFVVIPIEVLRGD